MPVTKAIWSTQASSYQMRIPILVCGMFFVASVGQASLRAQAGELIERTLAIVAGQVVTLADVRGAVVLGLVDTPAATDVVVTVAAQLIDRLLVLREVQRYAPPEPPDAAVEQRMELARQRFPTPEGFRRALDEGAFSEARLRAWVRDDLRIAAYLDQRFGGAGPLSDEDVSAYYTQHRDEFDQAGTSLDAASPLIRARLAAERQRELITDWIADLRRRTAIVELWRPKN